MIYYSAKLDQIIMVGWASYGMYLVEPRGAYVLVMPSLVHLLNTDEYELIGFL